MYVLVYIFGPHIPLVVGTDSRCLAPPRGLVFSYFCLVGISTRVHKALSDSV